MHLIFYFLAFHYFCVSLLVACKFDQRRTAPRTRYSTGGSCVLHQRAKENDTKHSTPCIGYAVQAGKVVQPSQFERSLAETADDEFSISPNLTLIRGR